MRNNKISNFVIYNIYNYGLSTAFFNRSYARHIGRRNGQFSSGDIAACSNDLYLYEKDNHDIGSLRPDLITAYYHLIPAYEKKDFEYFHSIIDKYKTNYKTAELDEFMKYYKKLKPKVIKEKLNLTENVYRSLRRKADNWLNDIQTA